MAQHNHRLTVPRFAPLSPQGIRRAPFLKGKVKVYLGPDQDLWSLPELYVYPPTPLPDVAAGTLATPPYVAPGDWSPAGALLRVPQVVHFSPIGDFADPTFAAVFAACQGVVDRLKALRPGRTWGRVLDWFDYTGTYGGAFAVYFAENRWLPVLGPPPGLPFFGCNYFHLYIGGPVYTYFQIAGDTYTQNVIGPTPGFNDAGSVRYAGAVARVSTNYDSFAGYACNLYGTGGVDDVFLESLANDLGKYGFAFAGGRDLLVDADAVLRVVADRFRFSPITGHDLTGS